MKGLERGRERKGGLYRIKHGKGFILYHYYPKYSTFTGHICIMIEELFGYVSIWRQLQCITLN